MRVEKREIAAYLLLLDKGEINLGEAIDLVSMELCTTKRTARRIIKRLRRLGFLSLELEDKGARVRCKPPREVLERLVAGYIEKRRSRCKNGRG
ncbi:MAG: hypothetical protein F7C33_03365 [Desulfurococcales archaeon]|nr:hypothetical protein [Desulfurococcales archaeon]